MFYVMHVDRLRRDRVQDSTENGKKSDENEKFVHKTEMHFNSTFTPKWFDFLKAFCTRMHQKTAAKPTKPFDRVRFLSFLSTP